MNNLLMKLLRIVWYIFWAVFVNALSMWIIGPLVQDLAVYGVFAVLIIAILWLTSLHPRWRRRWVSFTLFSLLLGQGLSSLAFSTVSKTILVGVIMVLALFIIALWFGKVRLIPLVFGTLAIVVANSELPISAWPFLTQFNVKQQSRLHIDPHDFSSAPFSVIHTATGDALLTVTQYIPSKKLLQQLVGNATSSPDALQNLLQTAQGEYEFVELKNINGRFIQTVPSVQDLAHADPLQFVKSIFPFQIAHFYVQNGRLSVYLSPNLTNNQAVQVGVDPSAYAFSMQSVANQAVQTELTEWQQALNQLGVKPDITGWHIASGELVGNYQGSPFSMKTDAMGVVGEGHFTSASAPQILLIGNNSLEVVDLSTKQVVTTYHGTSNQLVPNDIVTGPLTIGGLDAVFVNASPAYVLVPQATGSWQQVYTATSPTFRFETVLDNTQGNPQIVTDDPSLIRNSPTRYFSAYHFVQGRNGQAGQLQRDWRVFRTNVVNVTSLANSSNGNAKASGTLAVSIYGSGEYLILSKSSNPVLPMAATGLGLILIAGWINRLRRRKGVDEV